MEIGVKDEHKSKSLYSSEQQNPKTIFCSYSNIMNTSRQEIKARLLHPSRCSSTEFAVFFPKYSPSTEKKL